jgi:hypothetical protein
MSFQLNFHQYIYKLIIQVQYEKHGEKGNNILSKMFSLFVLSYWCAYGPESNHKV